jgi:hypothetical protein
MTEIVELFGIDTASAESTVWPETIAGQHCRFTGRRCYKTRKSNPSIAIGTCTVGHSRPLAPVVICPSRFLERGQIFTDCLHLLSGHEPGNELHVCREVGVPGGNIDFFLVSTRGRRVVDFVGIEIQTIDTTGTVWPARQRFLQAQGITVSAEDAASRNGYGMNWKMTAKTILVQLHHKIQMFEHVNKHLVLVVQDCLLSYMKRTFAFDHLTEVRTTDPMQFHSYLLQAGEGGLRMSLSERLSTDTAGIARCLGLQGEGNLEMAQIVGTLEARISDQTLFVINSN